MSTEGYEAFTARLLAALPGSRPRYDAAVALCRAEGIEDAATRIFLDEYLRELLGRFRQDPEGTRPELARLAGVLEGEWGRDDDLDHYLDALMALLPPGYEEPDPAVVLGPRLRAVVEGKRSWRARPSDTALVRRLLDAVPALAELTPDYEYGDHRDVLVHPFLGAVAFRAADDVEAGRLDEVRRILDLLEAEYGTGDADEPIAVSFVENLPYPGEPGAAIVDLLGPKLRAELARQR